MKASKASFCAKKASEQYKPPRHKGFHAIKASTPFEPLVTCGALNYNPSKSCQQTGQIKVIVAPTRCKPASKFRVSAQKAPLPSSPTNNRYKNQTLIKVYPPDSFKIRVKPPQNYTAKPASTESPLQKGLCPKGTPSLVPNQQPL